RLLPLLEVRGQRERVDPDEEALQVQPLPSRLRLLLRAGEEGAQDRGKRGDLAAHRLGIEDREDEERIPAPGLVDRRRDEAREHPAAAGLVKEPMGRRPVERRVPRAPHGVPRGDDPALDPLVELVDLGADVVPDEIPVDRELAETPRGKSHYGPTLSGTANLVKKSFWNAFSRSSASSVRSPLNIWPPPSRVTVYAHEQLKLLSPDGWGLPDAMSRNT